MITTTFRAIESSTGTVYLFSNMVVTELSMGYQDRVETNYTFNKRVISYSPSKDPIKLDITCQVPISVKNEFINILNFGKPENNKELTLYLDLESNSIQVITLSVAEDRAGEDFFSTIAISLFLCLYEDVAFGRFASAILETVYGE